MDLFRVGLQHTLCIMSEMTRMAAGWHNGGLWLSNNYRNCQVFHFTFRAET